MTDEEYAQVLAKSGIAIEVDPDATLRLCQHFAKSSEAGILWREANLIAAIYPEAASALRLGVMHSGREDLLVIPPSQEIGGLLRDALWIEGQATEGKSKPWVGGATEMANAIEEAFRDADITLPPLSELCFQDKVFAATKTHDMFSPSGRPTNEDADRHQHDAWVRLRVDIPTGGKLPLSFLCFDLCTECGFTARQTMRLGLGQALHDPLKHQHRWAEFSSPIPDDDGVYGTIKGQVCLSPEDKVEPPCCAVQHIKITRARTPKYGWVPAWVRKDRSILRAPDTIDVPRSHVHLFDDSTVVLVPGASVAAVRCAMCRSSYLSNNVNGVVPDDYKRSVLDPVRRSGGFARVSEVKLHELLNDAVVTYGEDVLSSFRDILASAACGYGLSEPTHADVDWAFRSARIEGEGGRRDGWRAAEFTVDGEEYSGFVIADLVGVIKVDGGWEVVHLGVRRRISFEKSEAEARRAAEDAVAEEFEPNLQAHRVDIDDWRVVGARRNRRSRVRELLELVDQTLNDAGVRYALIGGQAVKAYDKRRKTRDVDVMVESWGSLKDVKKSAKKHGFDVSRGAVPVLRHRLGSVDILPAMSRVEKWALGTADCAEVDGYLIQVVSPEGLMALKAEAAISDRSRLPMESKDIKRLAKYADVHDMPSFARDVVESVVGTGARRNACLDLELYAFDGDDAPCEHCGRDFSVELDACPCGAPADSETGVARMPDGHRWKTSAQGDNDVDYCLICQAKWEEKNGPYKGDARANMARCAICHKAGHTANDARFHPGRKRSPVSCQNCGDKKAGHNSRKCPFCRTCGEFVRAREGAGDSGTLQCDLCRDGWMPEVSK